MSTPKVVTQKLAHGFPAKLAEYHALAQPLEADLTPALFTFLRARELVISYSEVDVLSGLASQFLYSREEPECVNLSFVPPVETLFKSLGISWKELTPSGSDAAYAVFRDRVDAGSPILARLREPLIVYGYGQSIIEQFVYAARAAERMQEVAISRSACDRDYWRYPLDEGNTLIVIDEAPRGIPRAIELCHVAALRTVRAWKTPVLAGCSSGAHAYQALAEDLRGSMVDFARACSRPWMGRALWRQWTSRDSSRVYFDCMAPRFGGAERAAFNKAAFCYQQCVVSWRKFAAILGPTWNHAAVGFNGNYPAEFVSRWRNRTLRERAASCVDEAADWEHRAVNELLRVIA
ncbi:hypothetical protein HZB60_09885 [candidate division KSB1 bacterium]|nr:hypothetical protein [candidate division KSB1 bacterium]